jgi:hypothetical protein
VCGRCKKINLLFPLICCHVLHVFNHTITSSVFLSTWKVANIRPVAKVVTPSGPSDFRPISIVSVLSKAFERILHDHVLEHINGRNLLSDFQSGFRREHSTATALVRLTQDLRSVKAEGKVTVHVLLDFSKSFDLINHGHGLFVHKLGSRYDFHTSAMGIVSSRSLYGR